MWAVEDSSDDIIPHGKGFFGASFPHFVPKELVDCPGDIDFTHRDFAMTIRIFSVNGASQN